MPFGIARDILGSYDTTLMVCAVIPLSLCMLSPFIRKPKKEEIDREEGVVYEL